MNRPFVSTFENNSEGRRQTRYFLPSIEIKS